MDEAFVPLHRIVQGMTAGGDFTSDDGGFHMYIERYEIESPVELDVSVGADGRVQIGAVPPLYRVDTSLRPSFHQLRFTAERTEGGTGAGPDGG
jgi:hypothetical protein